MTNSMKFILAILVIIGHWSYAQQKSYRSDGKVVKNHGEKIFLLVTPSSISKPATPASLAAAAALIPGGIDLIFKIGTYMLERRIKKFTGEYSKTNVYNNLTNLPDLRLIRKIKPIPNAADTTALSIKFAARYTAGDRGFYFEITEAYALFGKALVTKKCQYIDVLVEVGISYYEGSEKKTEVSKPVTIPLVQVGTIAGPPITLNGLFTDKFRADKPIAEVSIKVIEANTCKIGADKLKEINDKFGDDAKGAVKEIIKIVIPSDEKADAGAK